MTDKYICIQSGLNSSENIDWYQNKQGKKGKRTI